MKGRDVFGRTERMEQGEGMVWMGLQGWSVWNNEKE